MLEQNYINVHDSNVCKRLFWSPGNASPRSAIPEKNAMVQRRINPDSPPPRMCLAQADSNALLGKRFSRSPIVTHFRQGKCRRIAQILAGEKHTDTICCPTSVSSLLAKMNLQEARRAPASRKVPVFVDDVTNCPSLTPQVVGELLQDPASFGFERVLLVDARYSYEHQGGHITGAHNISEPKQAEQLLLSSSQPFKSSTTAVVFYCEFSSERGPRMFRHVRNKDRKAHLHLQDDSCLALPNMFVLQGGYKAFVKVHGNMCTPEAGYVPMDHPSYDAQLKACRIRCQQAWNRFKLRSALQSLLEQDSHDCGGMAMQH